MLVYKLFHKKQIYSKIENNINIIKVTVNNKKTIHGKLQLFRQNKNNKIKQIGKTIAVVIGKNGSSANKIENDNKTPLGIFKLGKAFGFTKPTTKLDFIKLKQNTTCVDDTNSKYYTKIINTTKNIGEKMFSLKHAYQLGIVVQYNSNPTIKNKGSCIFLHIWKNNHTGTAGCIAMSKENIMWLLAHLGHNNNFIQINTK